MPRSFPAVVEAILSVGIDLEDFGSANWALSRSDALAAVSKFQELEIPILGGDVWEMRNGRPFLTLDNWYCRRSAAEPFRKFLEKSVEQAQNYIRSYESSEDDQHLFEIVIDRSEATRRG
jgi:Immunity protein 40